LRRDEFESASGGDEYYVFRGLGVLSVAQYSRHKKATVIGGCWEAE